jgi:hypothetical protein
MILGFAPTNWAQPKIERTVFPESQKAFRTSAGIAGDFLGEASLGCEVN